MDSRKLLLSLLDLRLIRGLAHHRSTKLFVFGNSYVDTGNIRISNSSARNFPYGITFPGKPSDGRVLTDYIVNQIIVNVKRLNSLGVKKAVVTGLGPVGCLPQLTAPSSFTRCNATMNSLVGFHNLLLNQAVAKLNNETKDSSTFLILDICGSFMSIIHNKRNPRGDISFETPLKPCCFGVSSKFSCGSADHEKGNKKYTLCEDPKSAFFWDSVHPTQEGWLAAFSALESNLK